MKQLEVTEQITYRFWRDSGRQINPAHEADLKEHAIERIAQQRARGYVEGELHCSAGPDGRTEYSGWWGVKTPDPITSAEDRVRDAYEHACTEEEYTRLDREAWMTAVADRDTRLGYWEWVDHTLEVEKED